jgi:ABC-type transporter Mla subunit MlaD
MSTIRDNLEKQGRRQDEMLSYLSHLPEILQSLPEAQRTHGETLRAIGQQLQQQIGQQTRLTEILAKVSETSTGQKEVLESLNAQVQTAGGHNQAISENLRQVSTAMEGLGQNSKSSSEVLQHMRDAQAQRDDQLQRIIERQGARFTVLLIVASAVSLAAVATAVVAVVLTLKGRG